MKYLILQGLYCAHPKGEYGAVPHVGDLVKMTHCWQAWRKCQACGHDRSNTMSHKGHSEQIISTPELVKSAFAVVITLSTGKRFMPLVRYISFFFFFFTANVLKVLLKTKLQCRKPTLCGCFFILLN